MIIRRISGSHCLDIQSKTEKDPEWLVRQRKEEVKIMKGWITEYEADLIAFSKQNKAPTPKKG